MISRDSQDPTVDIERKRAIKGSIISVLPRSGFLPLEAPQEELKEFGFPRRPDPVLQPEEYAIWQQMFAPSVEFEAFDFEILPRVTTRIRGFFEVMPRRQTSLNWSGAYITPRDGTVFSSIWGKFQVPTPNQPAGGRAGAKYHSSTWIGFDGQRRYYSSTLPQIGTAQNIDPDSGGPAKSFFAWWQWWVKDDPAQAHPTVLASPTIHAGDLVMCFMQVANDRGGVSFAITNLTTNRSVQFFQPAPLTESGRRFKVPGATAEWVMERPADAPDPTPLQLPDYGTVDFRNCGATAVNLDTGAIVERNLSAAKLIDMHVVQQRPERTAKISIAKPISSAEFLTCFR